VRVAEGSTRELPVENTQRDRGGESKREDVASEALQAALLSALRAQARHEGVRREEASRIQ
jgi:hypothetical protein